MLLRGLLIFIVITCSGGVKVNMLGSLTLGKEVVEALSSYLNNNILSGRRSMNQDNNILNDVKMAQICANFGFCNSKMKKLLNRYITELYEAVQNTFKEMDADIFKSELKFCLDNAKKVLKKANAKISSKNENYIWIDVIKRISAYFQSRAVHYPAENINLSKEKVKKITHNLILSLASIEVDTLHELCSEYDICASNYAGTRALNILLSKMETMPEQKVKEFVKQFFGMLPHVPVLSRLEEPTADAFRKVLEDMSSSSDVSSKDILLSVQKNVKQRLDNAESKLETPKAIDLLLLNVILSDVDHFYDRQKIPFGNFVDKYLEWVKADGGGRLGHHIKQLLSEMSKHFRKQPEDLIMKLTNEVRSFMDLTVGPKTI